MRYGIIDAFRGLAMFSMIFYHLFYDLVYFKGMTLSWFLSAPMEFLQQSTAFSFIFLSGLVANFSRHLLKRGVFLLAASLLVTAASYLAVPGNIIVFGVLSMLAAAAIITAIAKTAPMRIFPVAGFAVCLALFFLTGSTAEGYFGFASWQLQWPDRLYESTWLFPLGFPNVTFVSADYFPLLPWIFAYWSGFFAQRTAVFAGIEDSLRTEVPLLSLWGRYSLLIYLLHQPLLIFLLEFV